MKTIPLLTPISAILFKFGAFSGESTASVLTFDIDPLSNFLAIDQDYGDSITAITDGGFSYGADEGFTPNVNVSYGADDPSLWGTGYGNLTNVLFEDTDITGVLEITFTADPGYMVNLHGFELASFSGDRTIDLVDISGTSSLFSQMDVAVSGSTSTAFDFTTPLQANEFTIQIDARNLGNRNDDIAIDNIVFSQVSIPEPSSTLLLGLGSLGLISRRRRKAI